MCVCVTVCVYEYVCVSGFVGGEAGGGGGVESDAMGAITAVQGR